MLRPVPEGGGEVGGWDAPRIYLEVHILQEAVFCSSKSRLGMQENCSIEARNCNVSPGAESNITPISLAAEPSAEHLWCSHNNI